MNRLVIKRIGIHILKTITPSSLSWAVARRIYSCIGTAKSDCNYIGIDIKGARFGEEQKTAYEEQLTNVAFIRTQIELIEHVFAAGEVSEIWLTFPDPQLKFKRTKHRLTNPNFYRSSNEFSSQKELYT